MRMPDGCGVRGMIGCERCGGPENPAGPGYLVVEPRASGRVPRRIRRCPCANDEITRRRLRIVSQDLPEWARHLSFERNPIPLIPERALRRVRGYYNAIDRKVEEGRGLWLGGASGTGKTAVAAMLVERARMRGIVATFANVPQLLTRLQRTRWDDDFDVYEEALHDRLAAVPLLALDDFSASKSTPYAIEQLYLILNRRYNRSGRNATIVTTDLDRSALVRAFGSRLVRRLAHLAGKPVMLDRDAPEDIPGFEDVDWEHDVVVAA
jgi:DNA replication protein DnaC